MDLYSGQPYWLMKNGYTSSFPAMAGDVETEVCVMGAGITGALAARALASEGVRVAMVDKRHPGMGSTAASTALLQYEIDEPLFKLIKTVGKRRAEESYLACYQAIDAIAAIVAEEDHDADFAKNPSLYYASSEKYVAGLKKEYEARKSIGLDVRLLDREEVKQSHHIDAPAAILSSQGARVDAYKLVHSILRKYHDRISVYDTCKITAIHCARSGVELKTESGHRLRCRHLVIACGYESQKYCPKQVLDLSTTYALISKPLDEKYIWPDRALVWETRTPYKYFRITEDNRIIMGGRDDEDADKKKRALSMKEKTAKLADDFRSIRPDIPFHTDFTWAGAFGGTEDSLPYIGSVPEMPSAYFILGFGGNGIVFSQTGAEIVRDAILGRDNPRRDLYAFDR
ncbi:MAG: FAD-binding oxidoreductase [Planctomycetes bacterium]|nr:FAD-binding oxidoreductase [Planctomycetota bacterium]